MTQTSDFELRRLTRRYVTVSILALLASMAIGFHIFITHDWRMFASLEIGWIMIAVWIGAGLGYRVLWRNGQIVMKSITKPEVVAAIDHIIQIGMDTSERMRIAGLGKPAERIKIIAKAPGADPAEIYVSLGHFALPDIQRLMRLIEAERPDLLFVQQWLQKA